MDDAEHFGPDFLEHVAEGIQLEDFAPRPFNGRDGGPGALSHVRHALTKHPLDADHHPVAWLDEVDHARFHAGRAGSAHGERQVVRRLKHRAEHFLRLVHDGQELRIEVTDQRRRHRRQHARMHIAGAGAKQHTRRRI